MACAEPSIYSIAFTQQQKDINMYSEVELSEWLGICRKSLKSIRDELEIIPDNPNPVEYSLTQALDISEAILPGGRDELKLWLEEKKGARLVREVRVLRTQWRNPRLLKVQALDSKEVLRVKVKDAKAFRAGTVLKVIRGNDMVWFIDPDWDPIKRRRAMRLGGNA